MSNPITLSLQARFAQLGILLLSMWVQKLIETFPSRHRLLVCASPCMHNIALPLQALIDSGVEDNLINEVLAMELGCILEHFDKPISAIAEVFRVVTLNTARISF